MHYYLVFKEFFLPIKPLWFSIPYYIALIYIFKYLISFLKWTYITFFRPTKDLRTTYGTWALITGSTDGIGKAFAFELASRNLNLLLASRSTDKLEQVSSEIKHKFPHIDIKYVTINFSKEMSHVIGEIESIVTNLDVGILINNVGVTYPRAMYFHEVNEEIWMNVVRVNLIGTTRVTKAVLHGMLKRRKGAIINIGSGAAIIVPSHPLYAVYAATKAYIDQFSRSLHVEYKNQGIDVQCQVPLYVATKMASNVASIKGSSILTPTAEEYVKAATQRIGYEARCTPYWSHSLQWCITTILPNVFLDSWRLSIGLRRRSM